MKDVDLEKIKKEKNIMELLEFSILNIDKPSGPTSFDISDFVRKTLKDGGIRKTSHFGTLDPKVTGVLPMALNRACKLTGFFLGEEKEYVGIMRIHEKISIEKLEEMIKKKFIGVIKQTPPVKSRVKRVEREREIKSFDILEKSEEGKDFLFKTECQGGTYIRKLISDLGEELGTGAHMLELRRVRAGIFKENDKIYPSVNLYDFEKAVEEYKKGNEKELRKILIPGEIVTELFPIVQVKTEHVDKILYGSPIMKSFILGKPDFEKEQKVCIFNKDKFIEVSKVVNEGNVFAKPEFVLN